MKAYKPEALPEDVRVRDWAALRPGDRILIEESSRNRQVGIVDQVSDTGDVVWIRYSDLRSRRLVHSADVAGIICQAADFDAPRLAALVNCPSAG